MGVRINASSDTGYTYETIARKVIAAQVEPRKAMRLTASGGHVWDRLRMEEFVAWLPDCGDHLQPVMKLSCREVRDLFGMSPHWLGCFCCFGLV